MTRRSVFLAALAIFCWASAGSSAQEVIDPAAAKADPDFLIQGEYVGSGTLYASDEGEVGVQVVALGEGKFDAYVLKGGLPGDGWKRGDDRQLLKGVREGDKTSLSGDHFDGEIVGGKMVLEARSGQGRVELKRIARKSPTLGAKAPEGAKVLFKDGEGTENWGNPHVTPLKALLSEARTKEKFGDYTLHIEFLLSWMPKARGQGRSNSGVYVHDCYEIQVLDSFGMTGENNECGGFYSIRQPDVNMCFPPLVWQTYDIDYTGPKYDESGKKTVNSRLTLKHNGVTVHDNLELPRSNPGAEGEGPGPRILYLQGHGNKVQYNNIWLVEKK